MKTAIYTIALFFISNYSISQDLNWASAIGGTDADACKNIGYDTEGNVYLSGYVSSTINLDGIQLQSNGSSDFYLAKYNKEGEVLWAFNVGGSSGDAVEDIHVLDDGTIFVTGYFNGSPDFNPLDNKTIRTSKGSDDVFLARYNSNGTLNWVRTFGGKDENSVDRAYGLAVHPNGYVFITGHYASEIKKQTEAGLQVAKAYGDWDVFYAKYDFRGRNHFIRGFGGKGRDSGIGIEVSKYFKIYISGYCSETVDIDPSENTVNLISEGGTDAFLIKYKINGALEWGHRFGGTKSDRAVGISLYKNEALYVTGYYRYSINLNTNPGNSAGGKHTTNKFEDVFIAKFNLSGGFIWSNSFGGDLRDYGRNVNVDKAGNVYATGMFTGDVLIDSTDLSTYIKSAGGWDAYYAKYDSEGKLKWVFSVGGPDLDHGYEIVPNDAGEFFIAGRFNQSTTFGSNTNNTLFSEGINDGFFAKYSEIPSTPTIEFYDNQLRSDVKSNNQWYMDGSILPGETNQFYTPSESGVYYTIVSNQSGSAKSNEIEFTKEEDKYKIKTYPNPSNGNFVLKTNFGYQQSYKVQIMNYYGQVYYSENHYGKSTNINASYIKPGVYKLVVTYNGELISRTIRIK